MAGQAQPVRVVDLSAHGAHVVGGTALTVGARGTLRIANLRTPLPFMVKLSEGDSARLEFELDAATTQAFAGIPEQLARRRAAYRSGMR